jgi:hypothetical protein
VEIETGAALPAWSLRVVMGGVGAGCGLVVDPIAVTALILAGILALTVVQPGGLGPSAFVLTVCVLLVLGSDREFSASRLLLVAGLHLLMLLAAALGDLSWRAHIELRALWPAARRFLLIQAGVAGVALAGGWLVGQQVVVAVAPLLVGVGLTALAAWLLPRVARARRG